MKKQAIKLTKPTTGKTVGATRKPSVKNSKVEDEDDDLDLDEEDVEDDDDFSDDDSLDAGYQDTSFKGFDDDEDDDDDDF
jgi:hypothetical protein